MSEQTQEKETKAETKKVKIRVLPGRAILVNRHVDKHGVVQGTIIDAGREAMVTEAEAKEFCDQKYPGHYAFSGNRVKDESKHDCVRAVRVA